MEGFKNKLLAFFAAIAGILGLLFLYEKRKDDTDNALVQNVTVETHIATDEVHIDENNKVLAEEEQKRKDLEHETKNDPPTDGDIADFFSSRKS